MLRRTSLLLFLALFSGPARAQSPTPDAGTQPSLSTLSRPPEPAEGPNAPRLLHLNEAVQAAVQNQPQLLQ
ncbi:MAG TPA: hypothetical protein VGF31_11450, partial [Myxococcaceae bacterium]